MSISDSASGTPVPAPGSLTADRFLTGRTALVTGAASGIGAACAVALAAAGATVRAVDRDAAGAHRTAALTGGTVHVVDLSDGAAVDTLPDDADIVVNCAGIQHVAAIPDFPPQTFALIQRIMVEAPFRILRRTLPGMYARGWGRVVNISSAHGLRASAFKSAYVTAKHGLEGLSKVTALEGAPHGVTSNCVNPGYVATPLVRRQIADQAAVHGVAPEEVLEKVLLDRTAVKRLVTPEEVAEAVLWLCTPYSASVTGSSVTLDGGWTAA